MDNKTVATMANRLVSGDAISTHESSEALSDEEFLERTQRILEAMDPHWQRLPAKDEEDGVLSTHTENK